MKAIANIEDYFEKGECIGKGTYGTVHRAKAILNG